MKAAENEIWVRGRRAEAGCELLQLTGGSVTEMGLQDGHQWAQSLQGHSTRSHPAQELAGQCRE